MRIEKKDQGGKVLIDFFSVDDLAQIRAFFTNPTQSEPVANEPSEIQAKETENSAETTAKLEQPTTPSQSSAPQQSENDLYSIKNFTV